MLGNDAKSTIRREMTGLAGHAAASRARELADRFDTTVFTVYGLTRDVRPSKGRRADVGRVRTVDPAAKDAFLSLTVGQEISVRKAREILLRSGMRAPSVATLGRLLRDNRLGARERDLDLRPCTRFQAERPNQVWQFDTSGSDLFFAQPDGSVVYESPLKRTKNKPQREKNLWMGVALDDFSRCMFALLIPRNDAQSWLTTIFAAARSKPGGIFPFSGLPDEIYSDQDSPFKSERFVRIMGLFDPPIALRRARPYIGKRSKGKVERAIRTLKDDFEAEHRAVEVMNLARIVDQSHHVPTIWSSIADANAALYAWLIEYNNRIHGTTGQQPFVRWIEALSAPPRVVPDEMLDACLLVDDLHRQVQRDLTVSINGQSWQLPRRAPFSEMVGRKIRIWWSPGIAEKIWADVAGESFEVHKVGAPIPFGQFDTVADTPRETIKLQVARGADPAVAKPDAARIEANAPRYLVRPDVASVPDAPTPSVVMRTRSEALIWLRKERVFHTPVAPAERAAFDAWFAAEGTGDAVAWDKLRIWADARRSGGTGTLAGLPRAAAGGAA